MSKDRFYISIIALMAIVIFFLRACKGKAPCPDQTKVVRVDTVYIPHDTSSGWIHPEPVTITKWKHDTLEVTGETITKYLPANIDTMAILKDYFATRFYKDSAHTDYGWLYLEDSISQNRITSRKWASKMKVPIVTKTVEVLAKPKNQFYGGLIAQGSTASPLNGFGLGLMLKTKSDKVYQLGALKSVDGGTFFQVSTYFKISFKK